jgi:hypothetical protein
MEANAFRVSQVATRVLDEHTDLPELLDVRPHADADRATLDLQPYTLDDAWKWAAALGVELEVKNEDGYVPGWHTRRSTGRTVIDGVTVYVLTSASYSAKQWAELQAAEAVAA